MRGWWVLAACLAGSLDTAFADGQVPTGEAPWEHGVTQEQQDKANKLFEEGEAAYKAGRPADALAAYEAAVAVWEHPRIRLSMALMLVRQDRIIEAAESLDLALKYDAAPFS